MQKTSASLFGASSIRQRITSSLRHLAVGALGALALGTMITPAQATLDLQSYNINWTGNNGYTMEGTLSFDSSISTTRVNQNQLWDMSVSFFDSEHTLLNSFTQVESGDRLFSSLIFSFDRESLDVSQLDLEVGSNTGDLLGEYYLFSDGGLYLYSRDAHLYVSTGGTVTLSKIQPPNTPPTLSYPTETIVAEATNPAGAQVCFHVGASDAEDEVAPAATALPPSGSMFHLGDTTVNVSATDSAGLTSTGSFVVHVQDTTGPVIYLDPCAANTTIALGSEFSDYGVSAYDAVDQWVSVQSSGSIDTNTVGTYTITYTAHDCHGNAATPVTRTVSVVDPMPIIPKTRFDGGNYEGEAGFNVSAKNNITAVLNVGGQMYRAAFPFTKRHQTVQFRAAKNALLSADITLDVNPQTGEPVFLVQAADTTLQLRPVMYSAKKPAPASVAGKYTAVFRGDHGEIQALSDTGNTQGPIGSGFATFTVARDGHVMMTGRTAEGTAMSGSSYLIKPSCGYSHGPAIAEITTSGAESAAPSEFHVYSGLYAAKRRGNLSGTFILDRSAEQGSLQGEFHWVAPAGALVLYPHGIDTWGGVIGGRYEQAVPEGTLGLRFSFEEEASYVVSGAVAASSLMSSRDLPKPVDLRCRYTQSTGVLTGRGLGARSFQVIWLQEQGIFEGSNTNATRSLPGLVATESFTPPPPVITDPTEPPFIPPFPPYIPPVDPTIPPPSI